MVRITQRALLAALLASASTLVSSFSVRSVYLVDADSGQDVMELKLGSVINLKSAGTSLTLRSVVSGNPDCVLYDLDNGDTIRTVRATPYPFAGEDPNGQLYSSAALLVEGEHTLTIRACYKGTIPKATRGVGIPSDGAAAKLVKEGRAAMGLEQLLSVGSNGETSTPNSVNTVPSVPSGLDFGGSFGSIPSLPGFASFNPLSGGGRKLRNTKSTPPQSHRDLAVRFSSEPDAPLDGDFTITFYTSVDGTKPKANAKLPSADVGAYKTDVFGAVTGELKKWHKITIGFEGPISSENGITIPGAYRKPSVYADLGCTVVFTHPTSGKIYKVPCYFAADGNAANTGAANGKVWLAIFRPDETGLWNWEAEFKRGTNVAQNFNGDEAGFFHGVSGQFQIEKSDKTGADLRAKGRLQHVGEHYFKFADSDEYFLKAGPESPSNFLAYEGFDNTAGGKSFSAHRGDYVFGQPTWAGMKGQEIIGALNYLAQKGMNAITVNILSDDGSVFPWTTRNGRKLEYDSSKLDQWRIVFDHAESLGITIHLKLQETDDEDEFNEPPLEDHFMSEERKLLIREMVARFGDILGMVFDFGLDPLHPNYVALRAEYLRKVDPYNSPIVVQSSEPSSVLSALLNVDTIDGASLQAPAEDALDDTYKWVSRSASKNNKWSVSVDRLSNTNEAVPPDSVGKVDFIRENVIYGNLMAGGSGTQMLFGSSFAESDLNAQDFRSRDTIWTQSKYAITFFSALPLTSMASENGWLVENNFDSVFATPSGSTIVYYKTSSSPNTLLDFPQAGKSYTVQWFNPRTGKVTAGSSVISGPSVSVGNAPGTGDFLTLLTCSGC